MVLIDGSKMFIPYQRKNTRVYELEEKVDELLEQ
jgi:hypothetical protein